MDIPAPSLRSLSLSGTIRDQGIEVIYGNPDNDSFAPLSVHPDDYVTGLSGSYLQLSNLTSVLQELPDAVSVDQAAKMVLREAPKNPDKLWECRVDGSFSAPPAVDADGIAYVGSVDHQIHAIKDGKEIWSFKAGDRISYYPRIAPDGKTVIFGSDDKKIYAVRDGAKVWEYETGDLLPIPSCIAPDGTVFLANHKGKTCAVKDGKKLWEYTGLPYAFPSSAGPDGTAYVGSCGKHLYALKDGKVKWTYEAEDNLYSPSAGPDGTVYVSVGGEKICALRDGVKLWECEAISEISSKPVIGPDGTVFTEGKNDFPRLTAIKDGKKLWEYQIDNTGGAHAAASPDGSLYVANYYMKVFVIKDGQNVQELKTGEILMNAPSVGKDGTAYVVSGTGTLMALHPEKGRIPPLVIENPETPKPEIVKEDQWILIDGLKLGKK